MRELCNSDSALPPHTPLTCGFLRYGDTTVPANRLEVVPMTSPATAPPPPASLKRIVTASLIGTTIEWYDNSFDQGYDLRLCLYDGL
ncbi:hypothetical protein GCM10010313_23810 [Streptomyces violarus]|nr:hypothetical protein GCM10010313_23810 [Streptomyces violarus]